MFSGNSECSLDAPRPMGDSPTMPAARSSLPADAGSAAGPSLAAARPRQSPVSPFTCVEEVLHAGAAPATCLDQGAELGVTRVANQPFCRCSCKPGFAMFHASWLN